MEFSCTLLEPETYFLLQESPVIFLLQESLWGPGSSGIGVVLELLTKGIFVI